MPIIPPRTTRIVSWLLLLLGIALLAGAAYALWSEVQFRRIAVETDGRVVQLISSTSRDRDGRTSRTYRPVFTFSLPNGKEVRAEGSVSSNPPCCTVGEVIRVRYDPARPEHAAMTGFMASWFVPTLLGGMGRVFMGAFAAVILALIQSFSVLVISSRWQNLLLYGFLFVTITLFPRGINIPRLRPKVASPAPGTVTQPANVVQGAE